MNIKNLVVGKLRKTILITFDVACMAFITALYYIACKVFENSPVYNTQKFFINMGILIIAVTLSRLIFGIYSSVWRYTRTLSYLKLIIADIVGCFIATPISYLLGLYESVWFFLTITAITLIIAMGARFFYRLLYKNLRNTPDPSLHKIPIAIIGAGQLGAFLANELLGNPGSEYKPVFFIDKDVQKIGSKVAGLKVYAEDEEILNVIEKNGIEEIFIAIKNLDVDGANDFFNFYAKTSCKLKLYDIPLKNLEEETEHKDPITIRNFEIEDLLFRKPIKINNAKTTENYSGKTVLITGGGGSIGSELCRQVAKCSPKKLIILDIYENNAYDIQQELIRTYGDSLDLSVEIASVRDRVRLEAVFNHYRPDVVFHAAAHKHVPLMEHSGCEAIKNNVLGTYNTADMAEKYGVRKFILISTDKAVNPTNIMGASKRMCEMVVQCRTDSKTSFAAVRFGNVLGSNGSVIPLFKKQIEKGGPVTITDKRIIRYFMTIPEASQLVMQAGYIAHRGELFVLDMGRPVKIYDLAVNMIRLSGLKPGRDIKIEEIGLRPGEKLYEELLMKTETLDKTENAKIFIEKDTPLTREQVDEKIRLLTEAVEACKDEIASPIIKETMQKVVPTFVDPEKVNKRAERSEEMKMTAQQ